MHVSCLQVGVIITAGSLLWMSLLSFGGSLASDLRVRQASHLYDIVFVILAFSAASAAIIQKP